MPTATRPTLTPADHGREIDPDDFDFADRHCDYHVELIDGRVSVTPRQELPQDCVCVWARAQLGVYTRHSVGVLISSKAPVYVHSRPRATRLHPDLVVYRDLPPRRELKYRSWAELAPFLVIEVPTEDSKNTDLVRKVELYLEVPSIREYWILDPLLDPDTPGLRVYRRRGRSWQKPIDVPFRGAYETPKLLPGFRLVVDPDR